MKVPKLYHWTVEDWLENAPENLPMHQIWHPGETFVGQFSIDASEQNGDIIQPEHTDGWYSESYGHKIAVRRLVFSSQGRYIKTVIKSNPS